MLHKLTNLFVYIISGFIPRSRDRVVFGAWLGRRYADNSRYLFEYLCRQRPDLDLRWIGSVKELAQIPKDLRKHFVRRGSLSALWALMTAGRAYISHGYGDLARYNFCRGAVVTYLGHGLTIKRMGAAPRRESGLAGFARRAFRWANSFDHFAVSSEEHASKLLAEYSGNGITAGRIVFLGQPRTDPLQTADRDARGRGIRQMLLDRHGISGERRLVTYLPTFRDSGIQPFSFMTLDKANVRVVEDVLERHNAALVEKMHFVDSVQRQELKSGSRRRIIALGSDASIDTQDLLLATDILLTDYSGCYLDYLHLDRPVLHFAYDIEAYSTADRGLYYSLEEVSGGPVARDLNDLLRHLDENLGDPGLEHERRKALRDRFISHDGPSCERYAASLEIALPAAARGKDGSLVARNKASVNSLKR